MASSDEPPVVTTSSTIATSSPTRSTAAFMVGSAFLNRAHFDLFYHFVCIIIAFATIARREMEEELTNPLRSQGGRGEIVAVERAGFGRRARTSAYPAALPRGA